MIGWTARNRRRREEWARQGSVSSGGARGPRSLAGVAVFVVAVLGILVPLTYVENRIIEAREASQVWSRVSGGIVQTVTWTERTESYALGPVMHSRVVRANTITFQDGSSVSGVVGVFPDAVSGARIAVFHSTLDRWRIERE